MHRTAFTLMELLVVISIIMILMGMVFVGIRIAREAAAKTRTNAALSSTQAELASFKQVNGRYPEADQASGGTGTPWSTLFGSSTTPLPFNSSSINWSGANQQLVLELKTSGASIGDAQGLLLDGWKQPLHYRPAKFYPYTAGATYIDSEDPPGRDSYQLWSTGSDKTDNGAAKDSDDMTTWEKR